MSTKTAAGRIAIMIHSLAGAGVERVALTTARGLIARGHSVDLLLKQPICDYPSEVADGCRILWTSTHLVPRLPASGALADAVLVDAPTRQLRHPSLTLTLRTRWPVRQWPLLRSHWRTRAVVRTAAYLNRERPRAILAINWWAVSIASLARRLAERPVRVVATMDNKIVHEDRRREVRRTYPYVDAIIAASRGLACHLAEVGIRKTPIRVIHYPAVTPELAERASEPVDHPWFGGDAPVILTAGKMRPQKDHSTLLRAMALLIARRPARLIVLGKGPLRSALGDEARALGLDGVVDFPGFVENPFAMMSRSDLFVLSSRHEGLGNVVIEALACGCPVVSTDCPHGPREILMGGRFGTLVPVGDPVALADAMDCALDAPRRSDELRARAAFFDADHAVDAYESLLLDDARG